MEQEETADHSPVVSGPSEHNLFYSSDSCSSVNFTDYGISADTPTSEPDEIPHDLIDKCYMPPPLAGRVKIEDVTECLREPTQQIIQPTPNTTISHITEEEKKKGKKKKQESILKQHHSSLHSSATKTAKKKKNEGLPVPEDEVAKRVTDSLEKRASENNPHTMRPLPIERSYRGLSHFFLMGTGIEPESDQDNDDGTKDEHSIPTTDSAISLSILSAIWVPASSYPEDHTSVTSSADSRGDISHSDVPPDCLSLAPPNRVENLPDSDSETDDVTLHEESLKNSCVFDSLSDEHDSGEERRALDDLATELMSVSRNEKCHDDDEHEQLVEKEVRALSRMTLEELVQDFEEYQAQVINDEEFKD